MYLKFSDAYDSYLEYVTYKQKKQSKKTLETLFENRILPFFGNFNIYDIKENDYLKWQVDIARESYSNNYKKNLHYLIVAFFDYCILFHKLNCNVAKKVGMFKLENKKTKRDFYTNKEFNKFIKHINDNIYKQFFNFMFYVGTRPGEAMALKFSDLSYMSISINKTISEHFINGERVIDTPKSMSSVRILNLDKKLYKDLLKLKKYYIKKYDEQYFDYYIFGGIKPLAPTTINRHKKKACEKANVRPIKLHEFRHSHASLLYNKKIDIQSIKERLGHSSIDITMDVYVHLTKNKEKRVVKTLNSLRTIKY